MTLAITLVGPTALIVVLIARNRARMAAWLFKSAGGARRESDAAWQGSDTG